MGGNGFRQDNSSENSVVLENITKKFGDFVAVDGVSLNVKRGEFITLLGPSGSGKSTILMMIAGFETPTSGKIYIEGEMVIFKPAYKRNIGMAFQNYALFPHMTISDNIAFPLRRRKMDKKEVSKNVKKALELVELSKFSHRFPRQLSGGQKQRVSLARALVYNPPVLLLDEPLGALDKKLRESMQLEIKHLHESLGITMFYVTHDQSEALTMSDRIAVINEGRIEQLGSPTDLYEIPGNKFVADFIGDTNLIVNIEITGEKEGRLELTTLKGMKILAAAKPATPKKKLGVAIRPERIRFVQSPGDLHNTYEGVVKEVIYLGDTLKYKVLTDGKVELFVTEKNTLESKLYERGNNVLLGWQDADTTLV